MLKQIEPANCVGFYKYTTLYRLDHLQKVAMQVFLAEFKTVAFNAEFKALSCRELLEFIKNYDVNVEDEDIVFDAVLGGFDMTFTIRSRPCSRYFSKYAYHIVRATTCRRQRTYMTWCPPSALSIYSRQWRSS